MLRLLFILLLLASSLQAFPLHFYQLNSKDGLAHPSVLSIAQDSLGRIWLGTAEGINIYDGETMIAFKPYSQNDGTALYPGNLIRKLGCNREGDIFFKTNRALVRYDIHKGNFQTLIQDGDVAFTIDRKGEVWVAHGFMLYRWEAETESLTPRKKLPMGTVYDLIMDENEAVWLISRLSLQRIDKANQSTIIIESPHLRRIYQSRNGDIWVGSQETGLYRIQPDGTLCNYNDKNHAQQGFTENRIRNICEDAEGNIWFGTFQGLYVYHPNTDQFESFKPKQGKGELSNSSIHSVFVSNEQVLWVGTYFGGVNYTPLRQHAFHFYHAGLNQDNVLSSPIIGNMVEDNEHNIWICTEGGGLNMFNRSNGNIRYFKDAAQTHFLPNPNLKDVIFHPETNSLYIGTNGRGLYRFDIQKQQFMPEIGQEKGSILQSVNDISQRGDTLYLSANRNIYTYTLHNKEVKLLAHTALFASTTLSNKNQWLWVVAEDTIHKVDTKNGKTIQKYSLKAQGIGCSAIQIFEAQSGTLYIATMGNGVMKFAEGKFTPFPAAHSPLLSNYCYRIGQTAQGSMILVGDKGIAFVSEEGKIERTMPIGKELPIDAFTRDCGLLCTSNGETLVGGTSGLLAIDKTYSTPKEEKPETLFFTRLFIQNNEVEAGDASGVLQTTMPYTKAIRLTHEQNRIALQYAVGNCLHQRQHIYEYRLDGVDHHWYQTMEKNIAYTNLRPGSYTLHVRINEDIAHSHPSEATLKITILPPWYATWQAKLAYLLIFLLALRILYIILRARQRLRESIRKEQMEKKQIKEVTEEKFKFFTSVSHEFRTPLTLIIGQLELLKSQTLPPLLQGKLSKVIQQCNRLNNLVSELIEFRKYELGRNKLHVASYKVGNYIREIYESFRPLADHEEMEYTLCCDCDEQVIWFDGVQMAKVIYNLLSNAFKYTPKGGQITLTASTCNNGQTLIISVKDSGVGIGPNDLPYIFERFYQADNPLPNERQMFRAGIGLALVKSIVEEHGGRIEVNSAAGQGTNFVIHLPLNKAVLEQNPHVVFKEETKVTEMILPEIQLTDEVKEATVEPRPNQEKPVVLLVEDNSELLHMLEEIFLPLYHVRIAHHGKEALELIEQEQPELIISDVLMPEMSGTDLCTAIKNNIELCHIPVVLLTALNLPQHHLEGLVRGADDYICKPFSPQILLARCGNIIRSRRLLREKIAQEPCADLSLVATNTMDKEFLDKVDAIIEKNVDNLQFSVEKLASEVYMGRTSFYNKLKALTGMSPGDYINNYKLKQAALWLKQDAHLSVMDISERLGFNTTSYFCRKFKERYGTTPSQFRK